MWDKSIENNAIEVVKKICEHAENKANDCHSQNQSESSASSLIAVDLNDYLKFKNEIPSFKNISGSNVNESKKDGIGSSTPVIHKSFDLERSQDEADKYLTSPHHFPTFNIELEDSRDENDNGNFKKIGM